MAGLTGAYACCNALTWTSDASKESNCFPACCKFTALVCCREGAKTKDLEYHQPGALPHGPPKTRAAQNPARRQVCAPSAPARRRNAQAGLCLRAHQEISLSQAKILSTSAS